MRIYCFLFLLLFVFPAAAQMPSFSGGGQSKIYDGKISGRVLDASTGKPVEFATIALFELGSVKPLDGTVTDEKGQFRLKNIRKGMYSVGITFLGYSEYRKDSIEITDRKFSIDLEDIRLDPRATTLKEATVTGEKQLIENQIDKLVYNADKDITNKGGNAGDVLRKVPMVQVDLDGNIMLQGTQNVKVLINNKPSSLTAGSVADAMKMIPADEISKVEVITSPGAKYDAEGTGGIINIITKKSNIKGWSGMINAGAGTRSSNLFGNASFRKDRFGTALSFGGFGYTGKGDLTTTRTTVYSTLLQSGSNKNSGFGPFGQLTLDYDINSKTNLSASGKLRNFTFKSDGLTGNRISFDGIRFFDLYSNDYNTKTGGMSYDANIDLKRTFHRKDQELTFSTQLTNSHRDTDYNISSLDSLMTENYRETSLNNSRNRELTFQADYVHPLTKKLILETGAKSIFRTVYSDYDYKVFDFPSDAYFTDAVRSNTFDYLQDVYAGYGQLSATVKKFGIKTGVRYEHTRVHGSYSQGSASAFSNDYDNWVPSATVSYTQQSKYTLKLSYTQRIQRPGFTYLNPYVNQSDSLNISYGNPLLGPEKSHAFELGWNWFRNFGSINTTVYHRFTNNAIEGIRFVDTNDVYVSTYGNIGENYSTGMSIGINVMWQMKIFLGSNFNMYYYKVKTENFSQHMMNDGINYNISFYGSYKFTKRWGVQAFGNFNGPRYSVQGKSTSFFYYNLSARWELKNEKGGIGLGLDNFASPYMNFRNEYKGEGFTYVNNNKVTFFGVRISFDYRFGKMDFSGNQKKKRGIRNDDLKDNGGDGMDGGMMGGGK